MELSLTSIQEPPSAPAVPLETIRQQIKALEATHKEKGTQLSGRILHVTHYLPVVPTLNDRSKAPKPTSEIIPPASALQQAVPPAPQPSIPETIINDVSSAAHSAINAVSNALPDSISSSTTPSSSDKPKSKASPSDKWTLYPRRGHTAMISGIRSLAEHHEQVVVAWTGNVHATTNTTSQSAEDDHAVSIPEEVLSQEDKDALEKQLENYSNEEDDAEEAKKGRGESRKGVQCVPVWLNTQTAKLHYEGYCKTTLWPLFHYLLWQDVASEYPIHDPSFTAYVEANKIFAQRVADAYKPGDLIFIHDYHLLLAPKMIRELLPDAAIGLFVHAPFPSSEIFRSLPKRLEILDGMLGANLVCFQTYSYSRHFLSTCVRVCGYETATNGVEHNGSITAIGHCPIGIDAERGQVDLNRPTVAPKIEALRALYKGQKIIVGREKLDVSKGVVEKLQAFEKLLECYPEWRGKVVLIQVTQPALSESVKLERMVAELVSHINGTYGSLSYTPVHHYHQTIDRDEYFALLSVADLALITALRDGMNTTSMEYILCQENTNKAPLVLSEFLGTANSFTSALLINPHDVLGVAEAINQGLTMDQEEKLTRHKAMLEAVTSHTSHTWAATIVKQLLENVGGDHMAHQTPVLDSQQLKKQYDGAKKRLMLFDYDGTLTPIVKVPSQAIPTARTRETITKLSEDPKNVVYLISGRDADFLDEHWGGVKLLGLSAEHGCFVRETQAGGWQGLTEALDMSWLSEVEEIFKYYTERTSGSHIEHKKASITWHYRASDPDFGSFQCKQCHDLLENIATRRPIEVLVGKKNLEVRPLAINKGEIVKSLLYKNPDADFVFCAGDDKTDEDMFRSLRSIFPLASSSATSTTMSPPIAVTSVLKPEEAAKLKDVEISLNPDAVFSTAVGPPAKKTLARWHVEQPEEIVDAMEALLK